MRNSILNFLKQYEKGLLQMANSPTIENFSIDGVVLNKNNIQFTDVATEKELSDFLGVYSDSSPIYYSLPSNQSIIVPHSELDATYNALERPWYQNEIANPDTAQITNPYIDNGTVEYVITMSKAVQKNGIVLKDISLNIYLTTLTDKIAASKLGYGGYPIILDPEGVVIVHPTENGNNLMTHTFVKEMFEKNNDKGTIHYNSDSIDRAIVFTTIPELNWKIGAIYDDENIYKTANDLRDAMIILALITLLLFFIVLYIMISRMIKPLGNLKILMGSVSDGDLTVRSSIDSKDEFGTLAYSFNAMIENMNTIISVVNGSAANVRSSSETLSAVTEETSAASEEVARAVAEIAHGSVRSAEDAETVTERFDLLGQQINEITIKAGVMTDIATKAEEMNVNGKRQMQQLNNSFTNWEDNLQSMAEVINTLEDKVGSIGSVMDTITEISAQTNLLALNASIEAARAGDTVKASQSSQKK